MEELLVLETKLEELTKLVPLYVFVTDNVVMFAVCCLHLVRGYKTYLH